MNELSLDRMEELNGGRWLEAACIFGSIALSVASAGSLALVATLTIHACVGFLLSETYV